MQLGLDAFERALGRRPALVRSGGTLPIVPALSDKGIPTVITGFGLPDSQIHSPNERLVADYVPLGIRAARELFLAFAELGSEPVRHLDASRDAVGLIDLHSHVLPGLDDGAADLDEAIAICRDAAADGIAVLAATPHVRHDYPTTPEQMETALAEVQRAVGDTLRLVPGGELDLAELDRPQEELAALRARREPRYLLVETPYFGWPLDIGERLFRLAGCGDHTGARAPRAKLGGAAASRAARAARRERNARTAHRRRRSTDHSAAARVPAFTLLDRGLAHLIASDAHAPSIRAIGMSGRRRCVCATRPSRAG